MQKPRLTTRKVAIAGSVAMLPFALLALMAFISGEAAVLTVNAVIVVSIGLVTVLSCLVLTMRDADKTAKPFPIHPDAQGMVVAPLTSEVIAFEEQRSIEEFMAELLDQVPGYRRKGEPA